MTSKVSKQVLFRRVFAPLADGLIISMAFAFSVTAAEEELFFRMSPGQVLSGAGMVLLLHWGVNSALGVYRRIWRFTSVGDAGRVAVAALVTVLILTALSAGLFPESSLRSLAGWLATYYLASAFGLVGARVGRRTLYRRARRRNRERSLRAVKKRVLLVGAGETGQILARAMEGDPGIHIVGYLDDDPAKLGRMIRGIAVQGATEELSEALERLAVDHVVFCMPSAPRVLFEKAFRECEGAGVPLSWVPALSDIVRGYLDIPRLRKVRPEDLLGRRASSGLVEAGSLPECYAGKTILVTGAAGSIGSELVRQLVSGGPSEMILLDRDENGLFEIGREVRDLFSGRLLEVVADIRDRGRIDQLIRCHDVDTVFHAAAYKHVPLMQAHPTEAVLNNVIGTKNLLDAASRHGVRNFVLISTDKAVNPSSVMGATKRLAEKLVQSQAARAQDMRLCCVRFGNVLGSRASVLAVFQRQIAEGRSVTVTHPEARRYFMTIPEAVHLVLQAGSMGKGGEIFLLDMGDPVKIVDLAERLIRESGLTPGQDVEIEFTGLRPGEKVFEELTLTQESLRATSPLPRILVMEAPALPLEEELVAELEAAAIQGDAGRTLRLLESCGIGFRRGGSPGAIS